MSARRCRLGWRQPLVVDKERPRCRLRNIVREKYTYHHIVPLVRRVSPCTRYPPSRTWRDVCRWQITHDTTAIPPLRTANWQYGLARRKLRSLSRCLFKPLPVPWRHPCARNSSPSSFSLSVPLCAVLSSLFYPHFSPQLWRRRFRTCNLFVNSGVCSTACVASCLKNPPHYYQYNTPNTLKNH